MQAIHRVGEDDEVFISTATDNDGDRYYELKMTLEEVETTEEVTHIPDKRRTSSRLRSVDRLSTSSSEMLDPLCSPQSTVLPGGLTAKHQAVATEQLTTSTCEERQRYVIKAVRDPRDDKPLPMQVIYYHHHRGGCTVLIIVE